MYKNILEITTETSVNVLNDCLLYRGLISLRCRDYFKWNVSKQVIAIFASPSVNENGIQINSRKGSAPCMEGQTVFPEFNFS